MYYSVKDVASILKCDPETIRRRIRTNKLKAIKVNSQFKIKENDIIEMLTENVVGIDLNGKTLTEIIDLF